MYQGTSRQILKEYEEKAWGFKKNTTNIKPPKPSMENDHFPLRLISFNTLQPVYSVANNLYYILKRTPGYSDRYERARKLYDLLHGYDLCCLQEFCNYVEDDKRMKSFTLRGSIEQPTGNMNKFLHACDHRNPNGGLLTAIRYDMKVIWYDEYNFQHFGGEESLNRSASFTLINMNNYWEGKYLLMCNVHFCTDNASDDSVVREQQRGELFDYFSNLGDKLYPLNFRWENCGVIIAGCFNTTDTAVINHSAGANITHSTEYKRLLQCFGPSHDLLAGVSSCNLEHTFNTDLNKYADKKRCNDTSRMDYIFSLDSIPGKKTTHTTLPLTAESGEILTDVEISDHYPIVANVVPRVTKVVPKKESYINADIYSKVPSHSWF
jgi:hypothetical protein